ncbi:IPT/TIG domain-containing protein [Sunxiuqinia indica]|uniref:IPT/TIG domain-containing protein n=1 Tax=Sunxiuqinia indica TaxID=2692584 RepID=UPI00135C3D29|nr:IPT/TIG domain-containing protein [Sunxiuqinia indica]
MKPDKLLNQWKLIMLLVLIAVTIAACNDDNDEIVSSQVVLEAYGPSPALRGSELTFIGRNLDKVTSVVLPDNIEISDIEVVSSEKIKVTISQEAVEGYVKLNTPEGQITSKTLLAYIEPISISKISPNPVKAGETLTIEGDYLNLIQKVVLADDVTVMSSDFTTWERKKIALVVPKEAQSGIIMLGDTAEMPIELKSETILEVTLPSIASVDDLTNKKPGDEISISGANLDLAEYVILANSDTIDFSVSNNTLIFSLPSGTTDGTVNMIAFSGIAVPVAQITMALPTELSASPASDLRAGDEISISGVNMDLVTTAIFPGTENTIAPSSSASDKVTLIIPDAATSGDLVLNTASGKTVSIAFATLKPEASEYNPSPVSAGSDITITGTNLDLVTSVTFAGGIAVDVNPSSNTSITVTVPVDAETGELVLNMANGETVTAPSLTVEKPEFCYVPVLPDPETEINAGTVLTLDVYNEDKLTDVMVNGASTQYILQGATLYVLIPNNAGGKTDVTLVSSNGEITYELDVIGSGTQETVIFEGPLSLTWGDGGRAFVPISAFEGVSSGAVLKIYFTQTDNWGQAQINNGNWAPIPFAELNNDGYMTTDIYGDKTVSEQEIVLTQDVLDNIRNNATSDNALIIQGSDWIIAKISIIVTAPSETVIMDETRDLGTWTGEADGGAFRLYKASFADLTAGSILKFYFTVTGAGQLQLNDANWGQQGDILAFDDASQTSYEMELTQAFLDHILSTNDGWSETALVVQGQNLIISKVSVTAK